MTEVIVSDRRKDVDFEFVYRFLSEKSIWAEGIGRSTLQRALDHSLCFSAFFEKSQVGFARVITDYATYVWIDDVFVDEAARGKGVADRIIQTIISHKDLESVASWWLSSSNPVARSLFGKYGFATPEATRTDKLMALPKEQGGSYRE